MPYFLPRDRVSDTSPQLAPISEDGDDLPEHNTNNKTDEGNEPPTKRVRTGYSCDVCSTSYSEKRTLVRHLRTPAHCKTAGIPGPSYSCQHCDQKFARDDLRHRHEKEVHFKIKRSAGRTAPLNYTPINSVNNERSISSSAESIPGLSWTPETSILSMYNSNPSSSGIQSTAATEPEIEVFAIDSELSDNDVRMDGQPCPQMLHWSGQEECYSENGVSQFDTDALLSQENEVLESKPPKSEVDVLSIRSTSTLQSMKSKFESLVQLSRSVLIYKGASPRLRGYKLPLKCCLCQEYLGSSITEVRKHLDQHSKALEFKLSCEICEISFTHERDLKMHIESVTNGHCGFDFEHAAPCQGHHPPDIYSEMLTDNDRLQFSLRLEHWERAQLKIYLDQVNDLIHGDPIPLEGDCWSIGPSLSSLVSLASIFGHRKPESAPEIGDDGKRLNRGRRSLEQQIKRSTLSIIINNKRHPRNLTLAALEGDHDEVERILGEGFDVNARYELPRTSPQSLGSRPKLRTPLEAAIDGGSLETVKTLVKYGANINLSRHDQSRIAPLSRCIKRGNVDMARFLLASGAKLDEEYVDGNSVAIGALEVAISHGDTYMARLLLHHGADPNAEAGFANHLAEAVSEGQFEIVKLLLEHGADANAESRRRTPLEDAVSLGFVDITRLLLQHKANVNVGGSRGSTPLAKAASRGHFEIVQLLLEYGADVNQDAGGDCTALARAITKGHNDIVVHLLDNGADVNQRSSAFSLSPLERAVNNSHWAIVQVLLHRGADFEALDGPSRSRCNEMLVAKWRPRSRSNLN